MPKQKKLNLIPSLNLKQNNKLPKLNFKKQESQEEQDPVAKPGLKINFALNLGKLKNEEAEPFVNEMSLKPSMLPMDKLKEHTIGEQQKKYKTYEDIME